MAWQARGFNLTVKNSLLLVIAVLVRPSIGSARTCTYAIAEDSTKLEWKGYKFSEKTGVPGTFDRISWSQNKKSLTLKALVESISFVVDVQSINSSDKGRDQTLGTKFFSQMKNKGGIKGKIKAFDLEKGTTTATLAMNGVAKDVDFRFEAKDKLLVWTSSIHLTDHFQMAKSVAALAEACGPLHTGSDGKAVTWDEVGLKVVATYVETCQ